MTSSLNTAIGTSGLLKFLGTSTFYKLPQMSSHSWVALGWNRIESKALTWVLSTSLLKDSEVEGALVDG